MDLPTTPVPNTPILIFSSFPIVAPRYSPPKAPKYRPFGGGLSRFRVGYQYGDPREGGIDNDIRPEDRSDDGT